MVEQPSKLPFPLWLIAIDVVAAAFVVAGLVLHNAPDTGVALGLPPGSDLLLGGLGALGVLACAIQLARIAFAAAASKSSR